MPNVRLTILAGVLLLALSFLQYRLWFEKGGIPDVLNLKKALKQQAVENSKLKKRNDELLFQIERLQNSGDAVEARARNELGMVKKDETFYQVIR